MSNTKVKKLILKPFMNTEHIYHPDSGLVFQSKKERIVIGQFKDDELVELDDDAISLCKKYKFKYEEVEQEQEEVEETEQQASSEQEEEADEQEQTNDEEVSQTQDEVEEPEPVIKTQKTKKVQNSPKDFDVNNIVELSNNFNKELISAVNSLNSTYINMLADLQTKYDAECENHQNTQTELTKMKTKFDNIKSLFS